MAQPLAEGLRLQWVAALQMVAVQVAVLAVQVTAQAAQAIAQADLPEEDKIDRKVVI